MIVSASSTVVLPTAVLVISPLHRGGYTHLILPTATSRRRVLGSLPASGGWSAALRPGVLGSRRNSGEDGHGLSGLRGCFTGPVVQGRAFHSSSLCGDKQQAVGHSLIPVINRLQEVCAITGSTIDLPQIVVIGGQSSGKSSVLENLVGKDFLPRGSGIVTRRPLVLQLQTLPAGELEYGVFLHDPTETKLTDFKKIKHEIEKETDKVAGKNKGISNIPIVLKISSPHVVSLTLVDTPGIARVAIGDQPQNIEEQIKKLILEYISKPNAIILAVHPANQDLATSDALQLAKQVDPEGQRTLGVLTKIDLMDKGTDAMPIMLGRSFPLRRGWAAVVNRSQMQIDQDQSIMDAHRNESMFFEQHETYRTIADRCGVKVLAGRCNKMLEEHIRKTLPNLKLQLSTVIKQRERELESYGPPISEDEGSQGWLLMEILNKFTKTYDHAILGDSIASLDPDQKLSTLKGGARLRFIFNEGFTKTLNDLNPNEGLTTRDIKIVIKNASGSKPSLFVPDKAFEVLAQRQIKLLREPCLKACESVFNELLRILTEIEMPELMRFWKLRDRILEIAGDLLNVALKKSQTLINTTIDTEISYINTNHPDFIGLNMLLSKNTPIGTENTEDYTDNIVDYGLTLDGSPILADMPAQPEEPIENKSSYEDVLHQMTERERRQIAIIRQLLSSYFSIIKKNVHDQVTKIIMMAMVKGSINDLQKELVSNLYKAEGGKYSDVLMEATDVAARRKACKLELERFRKAKRELQLGDDEL